MSKLFALDRVKDAKHIGKLFTLVKMEVDDEGNDTGKDLRGRLMDIDHEGYYVFKVTTPRSQLEEFKTRVPNDGDIAK